MLLLHLKTKNEIENYVQSNQKNSAIAKKEKMESQNDVESNKLTSAYN
jgi:hypothetical protein